jgi:aldehyde dehydrogenase (NAD+)
MYNNIDTTIRNLDSWAENQDMDSSNYCIPARSYVKYQPLGVVLIIGAWNYPAWTVFNPLISAIAAGNLALVKPSEVAGNC